MAEVEKNNVVEEEAYNEEEALNAPGVAEMEQPEGADSDDVEVDA